MKSLEPNSDLNEEMMKIFNKLSILTEKGSLYWRLSNEWHCSDDVQIFSTDKYFESDLYDNAFAKIHFWLFVGPDGGERLDMIINEYPIHLHDAFGTPMLQSLTRLVKKQVDGRMLSSAKKINKLIDGMLDYETHPIPNKPFQEDSR